MRQKVTAVVVMAVLFVMGGNALAGREAGSCTIGGYAPGQFSLSGMPEKETEQCIAKVRTLKINPSEKLLITITGSADTSGQLSTNDNIALARAEQVGAKLGANFPDAIINHWSVGDAKNLRQVMVTFSLEEATRIQKEGSSSLLIFMREARVWIIPIIALVALIGLVVLLFFKGKKVEPLVPEAPQKVQALEIIVSGYRVPVEYRDGYYWSPFYSKNGNQVSRGTMSEIRYSLKGCLSKSEFAGQKEQLLEKGVIKHVGAGISDVV